MENANRSFRDIQLIEIVSRWAAPHPAQDFRFHRIEAGFSGALVFRVQPKDDKDLTGGWALKATPDSFPADRMTRNAILIRHAAEHCDLLAPPQLLTGTGWTFLDAYGFHWELSPWMSGRPLASDASLKSIQRGGEAIGRVHRALAAAAEELAIAKPRPAGPPRCVTDRIARLRDLTIAIERLRDLSLPIDSLADSLSARISGEDSRQPASRASCRELAESLVQARDLVTRQWGKIAPGLLEKLMAICHDRDALRASWVLRDVHRGHILFEEHHRESADPLTRCVLDYDAVDCDSPAADLARWSGDFLAAGNQPLSLDGGGAALDAAVAGYRRVCSFSSGQCRLAEILVDVNGIGGLANWLDWLVLEARQFEGPASGIQSRITHLIASVCRIC